MIANLQSQRKTGDRLRFRFGELALSRQSKGLGIAGPGDPILIADAFANLTVYSGMLLRHTPVTAYTRILRQHFVTNANCGRERAAFTERDAHVRPVIRAIEVTKVLVSAG